MSIAESSNGTIADWTAKAKNVKTKRIFILEIIIYDIINYTKHNGKQKIFIDYNN